MASEWEELEKLSKDELIIELVHWKNMYGIIRASEDEGCPWPYAEPKGRHAGGWIEPGEVTTHEWALKIAKYAISRFTGDVFDPCDLMDYGLDEEQCCEICRELNERGELNLPDGVAYGGDVE
ncbi:hypothetical protein [Methanomethylophilus alvi]|uniref:hypothetical protein n=1 Tax=Methanomethylophilus alvi TaxID=1291540 RepID=UPI0037DD5449